jgi:hypothetical protein
MGLSFTIAAGPRQRSNSQVRVPRDSCPHSTVPDSRLPQPGGPGPRIYIPQEHGGSVTPPGTGFHFRRLLRLAGLRWKYSTPPPHGPRLNFCSSWPPYNPSARTTAENTVSNSTSVIAARTCLRSLATNDSTCFNILYYTSHKCTHQSIFTTHKMQ